MVPVYLGLGSNLHEPLEQLRRALACLAQLPQCQLAAVSSLYASAPLGPVEQPDFVNAVARLDTDLEPLRLLDHLQRIERQQGRVRKGERWGPRTLDLDILLFDDRQLDLPRLQTPHYHMHARAFCLYPLAEIAPDLRLPDGRPLTLLLAECPADELHIIAAPPSVRRHQPAQMTAPPKVY